jgi:hypothetical protein
MAKMSIGELTHEAFSLFRCYPTFVYRSVENLLPGDLPVFVFHTLEPDEFEGQLRYLKENGYRTLSLDEFLATLKGTRKAGPREVLLTIDDARTSAWLYGYPLLQKYELNAVVFAITGWTPDGVERPNLENVWREEMTLDALQQLDPDDRQVCSWAELKCMHDSGRITVDSHSHLHRKIFSDRTLRSVIRESDDFSPSNAIQSPYLSLTESPLGVRPEDLVGLPLFDVRAFFEDGPAYRLDRAACADFRDSALSLLGKSNGAPDSSQLETLRRSLSPDAFLQLGSAELEAEIRDEIALARDSLRARLDDPRAGRTLCIPFTLGGETLLGAAGQVGLEAVFWGVSTEQRINSPGHNPLRLVRLKNDFLFTLPGTGRKSLIDIYATKLNRRLQGVRPY